MNISKVALAVSTVFLLSACGGDSQGAEDRETDVTVPEAPLDTDNDGIADTEDTDDDNDGYEDDKDNEPLKALVIPQTLNACINSLPAYPAAEGQSILDRQRAKLYDIERVDAVTGSKTSYSQSEILVGEQVGLPNGLLNDRNVEVTQVSIHYDDSELGLWNPTFEHQYVDADNRQYLGNQDVFNRWWGTNVESSLPADLNLNEETSYWVDRLRASSPEQPVRYDGLTVTYAGKDIIQTSIGLREVCVVENSSQLDLIDNTGSEDVITLRVVEKSKDYIDANHVVQRSERDYLEYDPANLETPTWGYTDYRKELVGLIENEQLFGRDPVADRVPEGAFLTKEQCLASLPDSDYVASPDTKLEYYVSRYDSDTGLLQDAVYTVSPKTGEGVSWRGQDNLSSSQLDGVFYDYSDPLGPVILEEFTETYYENVEGVMVGFEATLNGGSDIAWGAETLSTSLQSIAGSYMMPEVRLNHVQPLNPTAERASYVQVVNKVFAGKATYTDVFLGEDVPVCKEYRRWEATFYADDGSVALDDEGNPVVEFYEDVDLYDNRGLIERVRTTHKWESESWSRSSVY